MADFRRATVVQGGIILTLFLLPFFLPGVSLSHPDCRVRLLCRFGDIRIPVVGHAAQLYRQRAIDHRQLCVNHGVFVLGVVAVNPFYPMSIDPVYRSVLAFIQMSLGVESCVITSR